MALVEVAGHGVIAGRIHMPRSGAWYADVKVDALDAITGPTTISIADGRLVLKGSVARGAEYVDTAIVRVVAGAGGLGKVARARSYNQSSLRIVLGHLLGDAGEALSATADAATLRRQLIAWTTAALPIGTVVARALRSAAPAASWRALADGTYWFGPETWPDSGLTTDDYQIIDEDPRQLVAELGVEAPLLLPGTTLAGRRVSRVEHVIAAEGVRTWAWFEDAETGTAPIGDRLKEAFGAVVRGSVGPVDYHALHFGRVISQAGDTIDVEIENPTISAFLPSMQKVPLMKPTPGATVQMAAGGRVLIGWSGGDPARPFAVGYDASTVLSTMVLNVVTALQLGDSTAQPFPNLVYRNAEAALFKVIAGAATLAAGASIDPAGVVFYNALTLALNNFALLNSSYLTTKAKAT